MQPKLDVSVIIPTRGRPDLLRRAILSALQQTGISLEIVVVVDGADPATERALESIADSRVRWVALSDPVGGAEARNVGVRAARGRYIALLDDDDEWMPGKLAKQLALAEANPAGIFVVVTQYLYRTAGAADEVWPGHIPAQEEALSEFLFSSRGGFQTSTYLCLRALALRVPFTKGLQKHQDWDWFLRLSVLPGFELRIVREPLSIYWVPLRTRSSVSGNLDWQYSLHWARSARSLMTGKAYARFLVKICMRSAVQQGAGTKSMLGLLGELMLRARPTPFLLAEFAVCVAVPETLRMFLRRLLFVKRSASQRPQLPQKGPDAPISEACPARPQGVN